MNTQHVIFARIASHLKTHIQVSNIPKRLFAMVKTLKSTPYLSMYLFTLKFESTDSSKYYLPFQDSE